MRSLVVVLACVVTVIMAFYSLAASFYSQQEGFPDSYSGGTTITYSPGQTFRVSVDSTGNQGNGDRCAPCASSISSGGRYATFMYCGNNLVSGDTNGAWDILVV